ncbi:unnamed protein product [Ilex paraguariensis]|uniref:BHLH domain-containing protein n=1 Tax=Ilex paraguariensis TaxID=185542 RepID=A0ABC8RX94_9AQUA
MAEFTVDLHNFKHSLSEMISNTQLLNSQSVVESFNENVHGLMSSSNGSFSDYQRFPMSFTDSTQSSFHHEGLFLDPLAHLLPPTGGVSHESNHIKAIAEPESLMVSSFPLSGTGFVGDPTNQTNRNSGYTGKKRKRNEREEEKPREVVHVRARRGQATDSHSLAERLRREKINEKLKCLQDLVPGCYKTMGMAVMLDVIINYVRSLQNQIDVSFIQQQILQNETFLSMKLSAASLFYDFNSSEMEAIETMQGTNGYEAPMTERMVGEGNGGFPHFQSTWPV